MRPVTHSNPYTSIILEARHDRLFARTRLNAGGALRRRHRRYVDIEAQIVTANILASRHGIHAAVVAEARHQFFQEYRRIVTNRRRHRRRDELLAS